MSFVKIIFLLLTLLKIISGSEVFKIVNKGEKMCRKQMAVNKLTATKVFPTTNIIYTIECENVTFCPSVRNLDIHFFARSQFILSVFRIANGRPTNVQMQLLTVVVTSEVFESMLLRKTIPGKIFIWVTHL